MSSIEWSGPLSAIAMGCEPLGGTDWGAVDIEIGRSAVRAAWESGINVFDTADVYGLGKSEEELAKALGHDRHDAFIVTKFGMRWPESGVEGRASVWKDTSPKYALHALDRSLRRLNIERIPLYLVHWPSDAAPLEETLGALEQARLEGKVLNYGLSNFAHDQVDFRKVSAVEGPCSLLEWDTAAQAVLERAPTDILRLAYGALGQGMLTGKFDAETRFPLDDRRSRLSHFTENAWKDTRPLLEALREVAIEQGRTQAQVAIRWVLDSGRADVVVAGARSPSQVAANIRSLGWSLPNDSLTQLEQASIEARRAVQARKAAAESAVEQSL